MASWPRQVVETTASAKAIQRNPKMENRLPRINLATENAVQKNLNLENG